MPKYNVTDPTSGKSITLEGDTPPTEAELNDVFSKINTPATPPAAAKSEEPGTLQKIAQAVMMPIRGFKGIGVGIEKALPAIRRGREERPGELQDALFRAAEATKPGYKPLPGEKLGAFAGEAAATAPIFMATGGGSLGAQALKMGLTSGTYRALQDAADKGDINVIHAGVDAGLGAMFPLISPAVSVVGKALTGLVRTGVTGGTTLSKDAAEELMNNPSFMEQAQGTAKAVGEKVVKLQQALIDQHRKVGEFLNRARQSIGFQEPFGDSLKRLETEGFQDNTIQDIVKEYKILRAGKLDVQLTRPAIMKTVNEVQPVATDMAAEAAGAKKNVTQNVDQEMMNKWKQVSSGELSDFEDRALNIVKKRVQDKPALDSQQTFQIPDKLRLRELYRLRQKLDHFINFPTSSADVPAIGAADQGVLKGIRTRVNSIIETIPGGKMLRTADQAYSMSRDLYDELQKKLATQGQAEEVIQRIIKGGNVDEIIGRKGDTIQAIRDLERKTKQELLNPVRNELLAKNVKEMSAKGITGVPAEAIGPGGVTKLLGLTGKVSRGIQSVSKGLKSKSAMAAVLNMIGQGQNENQ